MPTDSCAIDLFNNASPMAESSARRLAHHLELPADVVEEFTEKLHTAALELVLALTPETALAAA